MDHFGIEGVAHIHARLGKRRITVALLIPPRHHRMDLDGGQGAVLVIDRALDVGAPVLLVDGDRVVLQLGGHVVHHHREGDHIAGLVHSVAVEGGLCAGIAGVYRPEVGNGLVEALILRRRIVALTVGGDGVDAPGAAGQAVALQVRTAPVLLREVVQRGGDRHAIVGVIERSAVVRSKVAEIQLIGVCVPYLDDHHLCIPQLIQLDVVDGVKIAVAVGGDGQIALLVRRLRVGRGRVEDILAQVQPAHHLIAVDDRAAQQGREPGVVAVLPGVVAVGPQRGIKDGGRRPVAQKRQVGQANGGLTPTAGEHDKALYVRAVGEEAAQIRDLTCCQLDALVDGDAAICRDRHAAQIHRFDKRVAVQHEGMAALLLRIRALHRRFHSIGDRRIGQVVDLEGERIAARPVRIVQQLQLAHRLTLHGDVGRRRNGRAHVHQPRALTAGGVVGAAVLLHLGHGGADQQVVGQVRGGGAGGLPALLHVLPHQGRQTAHVGRRHGGAAHHGIRAVVVVIAARSPAVARIKDGGPDVAAGGGDLRLQLQAGAGAPGGEGGHLPAVGVGDDFVLLVHFCQLNRFPFIDRLDHGGTIRIGDERRRKVRVFHAHVDQLGAVGIVVINNDADNAISISSGVGARKAVGISDLVAEAERFAGSGILTAALYQGNTGSAVVISVIEISLGIVLVAAIPGGDDLNPIRVNIGKGSPHRHIIRVRISGLMVRTVAPYQGHLGVHRIIDGRHGDIGGIDCRGGHHGNVRVLGEVVIAPRIVRAGVGAVASGGHQDEPRGLQLLIDLGLGGVVMGKTVVGAQAQVDHVRAQNQRILQGVHNGGIRRAAALVGEHLHNHQLRVRSHAGELDRPILRLDIARNRAGHVGAVVVSTLAGVDVDVAADDGAVLVRIPRIVEGVGDLPVLVRRLIHRAGAGQGVGFQGMLLQKCFDTRLRIPQFGIVKLRFERSLTERLMGAADPRHIVASSVIPEAGVLQIQSGVHHRHQHSLAGVARAPGPAQLNHVVAEARVSGAVKDRLRRRVGVLHIGPLDAVKVPNGGQRPIRDLDGHTVDDGRPLRENLHALTPRAVSAE